MKSLIKGILLACLLSAPLLLTGCSKPTAVMFNRQIIIYSYKAEDLNRHVSAAVSIPKLSKTQLGWLKIYNDGQARRLAATSVRTVSKPALSPPLATKADIDFVAKRIGDLHGSVKKAKNGALTFLKVSASADASGKGFSLEDMKKIGRLQDLTGISLEGALFNDSFIAELKNLKKLETVTINNSDITDPSLEVLATLPNLKSLDLRRNLKLNNDSLAIIPKMPKLEQLLIHYNVFTTRGIKKLIKPVVAPCLKVIDVRGCPDVSNLGAKHLSQIPTLEEVYFRGIIDNGGVEYLAETPKLKFVEFQDCNDINTEAVESLKKMKALTGLRLFRCKGIDNTFVQGIAALPYERLELRDLNLSDDAVLALKGNTTIKNLELSELPGVTSAGLAGLLGTLKNLNEIHFFTIPLDDTCMNLIATNMPHLKALTVRAVPMTAAGIDAIAKLDSLEELDIRENGGFTPADLFKLSKLKKLKRLYVAGTKIALPANAAELAKLRAAMTKCAVIN